MFKNKAALKQATKLLISLERASTEYYATCKMFKTSIDVARQQYPDLGWERHHTRLTQNLIAAENRAQEWLNIQLPHGHSAVHLLRNTITLGNNPVHNS